MDGTVPGSMPGAGLDPVDVALTAILDFVTEQLAMLPDVESRYVVLSELCAWSAEACDFDPEDYPEAESFVMGWVTVHPNPAYL